MFTIATYTERQLVHRDEISNTEARDVIAGLTALEGWTRTELPWGDTHAFYNSNDGSSVILCQVT